MPLVNTDSLHPYAIEFYEDDAAVQTRQEVLQEYCELPPAYERMAWSYLGNLANATRSMNNGIVKERHAKLLEACQSGLSPMVRFLAILPDVYTKHRPLFPDMPISIETQVEELGAIAGRSSGFLTAIAHETMAVSGSIERNQKLRGSYYKSTIGRVEQSAWTFVLEDTSEGLIVTPRFIVQGQIEATRNSFSIAVEQQRAEAHKRVGCLALHISDEMHGTVFESIWQNLVTEATVNEQLFRTDIESIQNTAIAYR